MLNAASRVDDAARATSAAIEVTSSRVTKATLLLLLPTLHY